ncbi:MAG: hypothetical protein AAF192_02210 [Pseudomonadota bacterium]
MIGYAVPQTGVPILPLDVAFAELRETPERQVWLGVMMFSTLLPTVLHASLALFAALVLAVDPLRAAIRRLLLAARDDGDRVQGGLAVLLLSALIAAALVAPAFLAYEGVFLRWTDASGAVVSPVIDLFECFARRSGALA